METLKSLFKFMLVMIILVMYYLVIFTVLMFMWASVSFFVVHGKNERTLSTYFAYVFAFVGRGFGGTGYYRKTYRSSNTHDTSNNSWFKKEAKANRYGRSCAFLGIDPTMDEQAATKQYKTWAKANHPDMGGSTEAMAQGTAAWQYICEVKGWGKYAHAMA